MTRKRSNSSFLINVAIGLAALVILFIVFGPEDDSSTEQTAVTNETVEPSANETSSSKAESGSVSQSAALAPGEVPPMKPRAVVGTAENPPEGLPEDLLRALRNPNPELPPEMKAQLNAPPPELPDDLRQQLENPIKELPADLQQQLNASPPPIPEDIKRALRTPPRKVSIEEVNTPPAAK